MIENNKVLVSIGKQLLKLRPAHIEYKEASIEDQRRAMAISQVCNTDYVPAVNPYLITELNEGERIKKSVKEWKEIFSEEVFILAIIAMEESISDLDFAQNYLLDFYKNVGVLFNRKEISVNEVRSRLGVLSLFVPSYRNTTKEQLANTAWMTDLMEMIYKPYLMAKKAFSWHKGPFVVCQKFIEEFDKMYYFALPAEKGETGFLIRNNGPKSDNDRTVILNWCQEIVLQNLDKLLHGNIKHVTQFNKTKGLEIKLSPTDLYTACILNYIINDLPTLKKGDDLSIGDGIESLAKYERQRALDIFRARNNRGTITDKEYNEIKAYSKKLISQRLSKGEMLEVLELHLNDMRKSKRTVKYRPHF